MTAADPAAFLREIAFNLVMNPSAVVLTSEGEGTDIIFTLRVGADDFSRVMGRQGHTARAIRILLEAMGETLNMRYSLEIEPLPVEKPVRGVQAWPLAKPVGRPVPPGGSTLAAAPSRHAKLRAAAA